jgi:hypothetical protein
MCAFGANSGDGNGDTSDADDVDDDAVRDGNHSTIST